MKGCVRRRGCTCKKKKCTCGAKWSFVVDVGIDPKTGKRKQKTKSGFRTREEAEEALTRLKSELFDNVFIEESNIIFKDFAAEWLDIYKSTHNVKVSTLRVREHEISRLMPYFAHLKMKDIKKRQYQNALIELKANGLSTQTLEGVHTTGRMLFKKAVEYDLIKKDPTEFARIPRDQITVEQLEQEEDIPKYLEKEELALFLKTAKNQGLPLDYEIFTTLAYSGIRAGELCPLKDTDILVDGISIIKTYYNPKNNIEKYELLPPKTKKSKRIIDLDPIVISLLNKLVIRQKALKLRFGSAYHDKGFLFVNYTGSVGKHPGYPIYIKIIENRMNRLLKLAGLDQGLTPHSLRHTHASLMAEAGATLPEIMDRLGHADDETTTKIYLHVTKARKKETFQKFSELMRSL